MPDMRTIRTGLGLLAVVALAPSQGCMCGPEWGSLGDHATDSGTGGGSGTGDAGDDGGPGTNTTGTTSDGTHLDLPGPENHCGDGVPDPGEVCFEPDTRISTGDLPSNVTLADLDQDGALDIAVVNVLSETVTILLGAGDGTFVASASVPTGQSPRMAAIVEVAGDEIPDLVVATAASGVEVALGHGDGTFAEPILYESTLQPVRVAPGDVDKDGFVDLAVSNRKGGTGGSEVPSISLLRGLADGSFEDLGLLPEADNIGQPPVAALLDVDEDGHLDVLMTTWMLMLMRGTGDGSFAAPTPLPGLEDHGPDAYDFATADLDGGGHLDIVTIQPSGGEGSVCILIGAGSGSFDFASEMPTLSTYGLVALGDADGDGRQDIVATNEEDDSVMVWLDLGVLDYGEPWVFPVGERPRGLAVGDLDSDGLADVVTANYATDDISILLSDP